MARQSRLTNLKVAHFDGRLAQTAPFPDWSASAVKTTTLEQLQLSSYCETMFHMGEHPTCQLRVVSLCFFPHVHNSTHPPKAYWVCMLTWLHEAYLSRHASRLYLAYGTCNLQRVGWGWLAMEDDDV